MALERSDALAVIAELNTAFQGRPDDRMLSRLFTSFGWDMLTDEALCAYAGRLGDDVERLERMTEQNRPIVRAAAGLPPFEDLPASSRIERAAA